MRSGGGFSWRMGPEAPLGVHSQAVAVATVSPCTPEPQEHPGSGLGQVSGDHGGREAS